MARNSAAAKFVASQTFDLLAAARSVPAIAPIEHVFVLMLENRSFDHLFGFSGIHGVEVPPATFGVTKDAPDRLQSDPPHEYDDVHDQIASGAMTGFHGDALRCFDRTQIPVLAALAEAGLLMDNWFSSVPGPTWPNRFFAHAASSGGLDNSPSTLNVLQAVNSPVYSYLFDGGHIFDRLTREGRTWRIYHGDAYPQVLALRGMVEKRVDRAFFRPFSEFPGDTASSYDVSYTFIEPRHDPLSNYAHGNSQHPLGSVSEGEALVRDVYQSIFSNSTGARSVLAIVWDEHGGFFDHVPPPAAIPPGDSPRNRGRAQFPKEFSFDRFGVRVPALIVSPWLPSGLGTRVFPGQVFDHASIISSLRMTFGLGEPLTQRDAAAPSWYTEVLPEPRPLPSVLPVAARPAEAEIASAGAPSSPSLIGTFEIAAKLDWQLAAQLGQPPLVASQFRDRLTSSLGEAGSATQQQVLRDYIAAVGSLHEHYASQLDRE
jgi:phospholipase C